MKQRMVDMRRWIPVVAAVAMIAVTAGCGSEGDILAPGSVSDYEFSAPPAGSGLGLLAVGMQSVGTLNDSMGVGEEDTTGTAQNRHGKPQRTILQDLILTFDSIRIYPACHDTTLDDEEEPVGDTEADLDGPWAYSHGDSACDYIEFLLDPMTLSAGALDAELALLLGTLDLPTGDYSHITLHIAEASVVTEEGETIPVGLPGNNEFLKVIVKFTVGDGQITEILITFDLARSVIETPPGSKQFILRPVMHGSHGQGEGYMGDMGRGEGDGDGGSGMGGYSAGTGLSLLGGDQVQHQIISWIGNDNGEHAEEPARPRTGVDEEGTLNLLGDQDQIRAQDGSCDSTCTGDQDPDRDRARDGSCQTTIGE